MRPLPLLLAPVVLCLTGCSTEMARSARLQDGKVCVEPRKLEGGIDLLRIAHAAGYLACREHVFSPTNDPRIDVSQIAQLVLLASAEQTLGNGLATGRQEEHAALAAVCDAAAREVLRPDNWLGAEEVIGACERKGASLNSL
jgi:hypothetical protein